MDAMHEGKLTGAEVRRLLEELAAVVPRPECRTCDCLQDFLTQPELDACEDATALAGLLKVPPEHMQACLGRDACPPAAAYASYLRRRGRPGGGRRP
jgi:hypothetical protein